MNLYENPAVVAGPGRILRGRLIVRSDTYAVVSVGSARRVFYLDTGKDKGGSPARLGEFSRTVLARAEVARYEDPQHSGEWGARRREIAARLARGEKQAEIARALNISRQAVGQVAAQMPLLPDRDQRSRPWAAARRAKHSVRMKEIWRLKKAAEQGATP